MIRAWELDRESVRDRSAVTLRAQGRGHPPLEATLAKQLTSLSRLADVADVRRLALHDVCELNRAAADPVADIAAGAARPLEPRAIDEELVAVKPPSADLEEADLLAIEHVASVAAATFLKSEVASRHVLEGGLAVDVTRR